MLSRYLVKKYIEGKNTPFLAVKAEEPKQVFNKISVFRKNRLSSPPLFLFEKKMKFRLD